MGMPAVTTRFVFPVDQPYLDVEITLHNKPRGSLARGRLALSAGEGGATARYRLGRLGSIIDPAHDTLPGTNRYIWALNSGLTVTDSRATEWGFAPWMIHWSASTSLGAGSFPAISSRPDRWCT